MTRLNLKKPKKRKGSLSALKNKAWKYASLVVRQRDADYRGVVTCYTCGRQGEWEEMQAGHAIGGRHNAVLLDLSICRPQCISCNIFKRGNYQIFVTKLIEENGFEWWQKKLEASRQIVKKNLEDYESFIDECKLKLEVIERSQKWQKAG
jgi:hypothetical protein